MTEQQLKMGIKLTDQGARNGARQERERVLSIFHEVYTELGQDLTSQGIHHDDWPDNEAMQYLLLLERKVREGKE